MKNNEVPYTTGKLQKSGKGGTIRNRWGKVDPAPTAHTVQIDLNYCNYAYMYAYCNVYSA